MSKFQQMTEAVRDANNTLRAADQVAYDMGRMVVGRLRHCSVYTCEQLKRELKDFNIHTGNWK